MTHSGLKTSTSANVTSNWNELIGHMFLGWLFFRPFWGPIRVRPCSILCVHPFWIYPFCTWVCISWSNVGFCCLGFLKYTSTIWTCPWSRKACDRCILLVPESEFEPCHVTFNYAYLVDSRAAWLFKTNGVIVQFGHGDSCESKDSEKFHFECFEIIFQILI